MTTEDPQGSEPVPSRMTQTSEENVYHGQGTLRRRRGNPAGLVLEGADGCGGRTGRESNRWQGRSRGWFGGDDCQQDGLSRAQYLPQLAKGILALLPAGALDAGQNLLRAGAGRRSIASPGFGQRLTHL